MRGKLPKLVKSETQAKLHVLQFSPYLCVARASIFGFQTNNPTYPLSHLHHRRRSHATMLAQRACSNVRSILSATRAVPPVTRAFSAGTLLQGSARAPALGDITPDAATSFNKKQKEFRDGLVAAQKQKEQQESASLPDDWSTSECSSAEFAAAIT